MANAQSHFLPRRIILVRHGESQGNKDTKAYTTIPDHKIPLTQRGLEQGRIAGQSIHRLISDNSSSESWRAYFYVSPYERTRSTLREIGRSFSRKRIIGVREECRIREQDFGNFQVEERMKAVKEARARFGRFFYRFPEGESAADVYDRVSRILDLYACCVHFHDLTIDIGVVYFFWVKSTEAIPQKKRKENGQNFGFLESLWRDIDMKRLRHEPSHDLNLIIVTHGLTSRVFLMKWFKWTVEQFEQLNNPGNCEIRVMQLGEGGEYSLAIHHTDEEMEEWGLSPEMIADQKWRAHAKRGKWNEKCPWYLDAFFDHPAVDSDDNLDEDNHHCNSIDSCIS